MFNHIPPDRMASKLGLIFRIWYGPYEELSSGLGRYHWWGLNSKSLTTGLPDYPNQELSPVCKSHEHMATLPLKACIYNGYYISAMDTKWLQQLTLCSAGWNGQQVGIQNSYLQYEEPQLQLMHWHGKFVDSLQITSLAKCWGLSAEERRILCTYK